MVLLHRRNGEWPIYILLDVQCGLVFFFFSRVLLTHATCAPAILPSVITPKLLAAASLHISICELLGLLCQIITTLLTLYFNILFFFIYTYISIINKRCKTTVSKNAALVE